MHKITIKNLSLSQIANSGQCFRWKEIAPNSYEIPAFGKIFKASQDGDQFSFSCTPHQWESTWAHYFDLQTDYAKIIRRAKQSKNAYLISCVKRASGMRILRQDLWETIISFIISQNNNIPRIKGSIEKLCELASNNKACSASTRDRSFFKNRAFPCANDIDPAQLLLEPLGLGYRAQYLHDIFAFAQANPSWQAHLKTLNYEEAMTELMQHKGIGKKVANCICLFGLHHIQAFPIDTHVQTILDEHFPSGFDFETFGDCAGIIQQYMFYSEIN